MHCHLMAQLRLPCTPCRTPSQHGLPLCHPHAWGHSPLLWLLLRRHTRPLWSAMLAHAAAQSSASVPTGRCTPLPTAAHAGAYGSTKRYKSFDRLRKVNDVCVVGAGGELSDFQYIMRWAPPPPLPQQSSSGCVLVWWWAPPLPQQWLIGVVVGLPPPATGGLRHASVWRVSAHRNVSGQHRTRTNHEGRNE